MRQFQAAVRKADTEPPLIVPWRDRVITLEDDNRKLRRQNADLEATIQAYAEAIADQSTAVEAQRSAPLAPVRALR
jgi:hypothetical protein